jgi:hypothetical protein
LILSINKSRLITATVVNHTGRPINRFERLLCCSSTLLVSSLMNHLIITIVSMLAAAVSIAAILPQLVCMLRTQSSAGQSSTGWLLGAATNISLLFVNIVGYHADLLACGNALALCGDLMAVTLIERFRNSAADHHQLARQRQVADMQTQEFAVLRDAVVSEHHRRTGERELAWETGELALKT